MIAVMNTATRGGTKEPVLMRSTVLDVNAHRVSQAVTVKLVSENLKNMIDNDEMITKID